MIVKKEEAQTISELLKELFKTHSFESEEHEGWIIPEGSDYAMKGYWYPEATDNAGQLTIEVFINSEMIIVESFSGQGLTNKDRLKNAFSSFIHHLFLSLLEALWKKKSLEIKKDTWTINNEEYHVYIGNQGVINYDKTTSLILPSSYTSCIKKIILNEPLEKSHHWFTFFYANLNGLDNYSEVLKDNIKLISSADQVKTLEWKRSNHYYAVRQFFILKKVS